MPEVCSAAIFGGASQGIKPSSEAKGCSGGLADKALCIAQPVLELSLQTKIVRGEAPACTEVWDLMERAFFYL